MRNRSLLSILALAAACGSAYEDDHIGPVSELSSALGSAPELKRIALRTGVELAYREQGSPHGKPVLFLHGYTASHRHFDLNLPRLPRELHVFALDLRGHGGSSKPACCYTHDDFAADVIAFMDALCLPRAALVGHSMGSLIAHKVAVEAPERVDELVLISSAPTAAGNPTNAGLQSAVDALVDPIDPQFARQFEASIFFRPVPDAFLDTATSESLKIPAAIWQQTLAALIAEDHTSQLPRIRARTLLMWGDQDSIFSAADQSELEALIRHSTLHVYEQTGHGLHVERPERATRDIARFLR